MFIPSKRASGTVAIVFALLLPLAEEGLSAPVPPEPVPVVILKANPEPAAAQRRRRRRRRGQRQPTAARVREIQVALVKAGYLKGEPAGVWGEATSAAMTRYQKDNDLPVTGKPEARTLILLGLGPETAGKGAPRPPSTPEPEKEEGTEPPETDNR